MNENKLENLMQSYKDTLGQARRPEPKDKPSAVPRLAFTGLAVAALATGVVLWPRDASAAAVERLRKAIRNANSMEMVFAMEGATGFKEFVATTYKDGAWRYDSRSGTALEGTFIIANGRCISNYKNLDHATSELADHQMSHMFTGAEVDALDFAMQQTDMGAVGRKRDIKLLPGIDASTYKMRLERPSDDYVAEILIDKKTDLPISTEISMMFGGDDKQQRYRQSYRFNEQVPDSLFQVPKGRPVLDLVVEQSKLVKAWSKPLASVETTEIRDARVSPDGTIWILVTAPIPPEMPKIIETADWEKHRRASAVLLPSEIDAGNGISYGRAQEIVPSSILGKPQTFKIDGETAYIVPFVPLTKTPEQPGKVTLRLATRLPHMPGFSDPGEVKSREAKEVVTVLVTKENGAMPSYFPALDLDHFGFQVPILLADTKAKAFEAVEDWKSAGRAYEECAHAYAGFVKVAGHIPLRQAAACYEKAGMPDDAQRVREAGDKLRAEGRR